MTTRRHPPICDGCKHLDRVWRLRRALTERDRCEAFPDGIPEEIIGGGFDHREPFRGDHGIRFELQPGKEDDLEFYERYQRATTA